LSFLEAVTLGLDILCFDYKVSVACVTTTDLKTA